MQGYAHPRAIAKVMSTLDKSSAYFPLVLSAANVTSNVPPYNQLTFNFPGNINLTGRQIALASLNMYYSWPSITNLPPYGPNNTFSFQWVDGSTNVVAIPTGGFSVADISAFLDFTFQTLGFYLVDNNGDNVYFGGFLTNSTYYAVQWVAETIPLTLPTGWTVPAAAATWYAAYQTGATPLGPQLNITNQAFGNVIGFALGNYPAALPTANYSALSTFTPEVSFVSSVLVTTTAGNNPLSLQNQVLYSFAPAGVAYGGTIQILPPELLWVDCISGQQQQITVNFLDQNFLPLYILDPEMTVMLVIKNAKR